MIKRTAEKTTNLYYIRIQGTNRYLTNNGSFWGYGQYYHAVTYKTVKRAQEVAQARACRLSPGKTFEIVDAFTLDAVPTI